MMAGHPVKAFKTKILHLYKYGEQTDCRNAINSRIKNDPFFSQGIQGKQGKQHKPDLGDTRIGQHAFYALLEYRRNISDEKRNGRNDGHKYLPLRFYISECVIEQTDKGDKGPGFYHGGHKRSDHGGCTVIYIGRPEMKRCCGYFKSHGD